MNENVKVLKKYIFKKFLKKKIIWICFPVSLSVPFPVNRQQWWFLAGLSEDSRVWCNLLFQLLFLGFVACLSGSHKKAIEFIRKTWFLLAVAEESLIQMWCRQRVACEINSKGLMFRVLWIAASFLYYFILQAQDMVRFSLRCFICSVTISWFAFWW